MVKLYCFKAKIDDSEKEDYNDPLLNKLKNSNEKDMEWEGVFDFTEIPNIIAISSHSVEYCTPLDVIKGTLFSLNSGLTMACTMEFDKFIEIFE